MRKVIFVFFIIFFFLPKYSLADSDIACPNFEFNKNFQKGDTDEEVYVLQQILNLDKRTLVAQSGPGSIGKETAFFGVATREALKRFQALFIEYIEIADGKFNTKTRTVMNNVCQSAYFKNGTGNVFDPINQDKVKPIIGISGPENIENLEPFRMYLAGSEALKTPTLVGLIIDNATAGDIRKTSSTTFSFLVTPNTDATGKITIQFEADSIEDLAGNKNENASNEWIVNIVATGSPATTTDTSILDSILSSIPIATTTDCSQVGNVNVYDYQNPCYGKVPMAGGQGDSQQQPKQQDNMLQQLLQGLMQGLMSALGKGGGQDAGGKGAPSGACMCPPLQGQPTGVLAGLKGPSGGTLLTPCPGAGNYVGKTYPPPPVCGQAFIKGKCINPKADSSGVVLTSTVGACGPDWHWGGN
jgi:hypothetical protein